MSVWNRVPQLASELLECIAKKWSSGLTADHLSPIAGETITRNQCIGKAKRMGKQFNSGEYDRQRPRSGNRTTGPRVAKVHPRPHQAMSIMGRRERSEPIPPSERLSSEAFDATIPVAQRKTLLELTDKTCKYPVGDVGNADFFFCGGDALEDAPYCRFHTSVCWAGIPARNKPQTVFRG